MKKLIYLLLFVAGISFAASNVTFAQDAKAGTACCQSAKAGMTKANCPMATAEKTKAECPKKCPMAEKVNCDKANCPMANKKDCTKANCPMKAGAVTVKKSKSKSGPVAQTMVR